MKKDQDQDMLKITIEKAKVMKDQEQVEPDDIDAQNKEVSQQEYKQTNLHQAKTEGTKYQAKGGVKNKGIGVSQLEDKQNKEITIEEAEVKKDQERVEQEDKQNKEITIEEAGVRKDQERDELEITMKENHVPSINNFKTDDTMDDSRKIGARGSTNDRKGNMAVTMKEMFVTMAESTTC